jgi:hypothetical protein
MLLINFGKYVRMILEVIYMYPYHNRLKQLLNTEDYYVQIETGKFSHRFYFPRIGKSMPIREYRVLEYVKYIDGKVI